MVTLFQNSVYQIVRKVPEGKITTYKEIAKKLKTKAYRAVGNALKNNPCSPEVPCHRVIRSDGSVGGFKGVRNNPAKHRLLKKEGIIINNNKINLKKFLCKL
ncbi:MAG: MGMT family protein [Nanoarchaeota archaeon]